MLASPLTRRVPTPLAQLSAGFLENLSRPAFMTLPCDGPEAKAYDLSGSGNPAEIENGGVTTTSNDLGILGQAWQFNGSQYAQGSSPVMTVTSGLTLAILYQPVSISTSRQVAFYVGTGASNGYGISASSGTIGDATGKISILYGGVAWNVTGTSYVVGNWHLVVLVQFGNTLSVYLNGATNIGTFTSTPNAPTGSTWLAWDGGNGKANGNVAFAAAWKSPFTTSKCSQLYSTLLYGEPFPLFEPTILDRCGALSAASAFKASWATPASRILAGGMAA